MIQRILGITIRACDLESLGIQRGMMFVFSVFLLMNF